MSEDELDAWVIKQLDCWNTEKRCFDIQKLADKARAESIQTSALDLGMSAHFVKHKLHLSEE